MGSHDPSKAETGARQIDQPRLAAIAEHTLHHLEETAARVRQALGEQRSSASNVFAVVNTVTGEEAVRNLDELTASQQRELRTLSAEPAIARIVTRKEDSGHPLGNCRLAPRFRLRSSQPAL